MDLTLLATGRANGKTTQAVEWVLGGEKCPGYPGWTRVLVLVNLQQFDLIRSQWWSKVEDFDHRIYTLRDWRTAFGVNPDTEVCLDNAEDFLPQMPGYITHLTMTAKPWGSA